MSELVGKLIAVLFLKPDYEGNLTKEAIQGKVVKVENNLLFLTDVFKLTTNMGIRAERCYDQVISTCSLLFVKMEIIPDDRFFRYPYFEDFHLQR
ncbi:MAG TPA: hypothetical protein P5232_03860 [Candidatus Moranbacteria bacterium]|nr:hypothetical protein [Candidatus Moranbacteria bacterium]